MKAILLISHGSDSPKIQKEISRLMEVIKNKSKFEIVEYAFLDVQLPRIPEGIDLCVRKGADKIFILLNFLNSGRHVDSDIPHHIEKAKEKFPGIMFSVSKPIGQHEQIPEIFLDMLKSSPLQ